MLSIHWCEWSLSQIRHDVGNDTADAPAQSQGIVSKWRQKERLKTTAVALVLCLNIGVDPPDVIKISPCARLECWVDPLSMQPPKALETIGQLPFTCHQPRECDSGACPAAVASQTLTLTVTGTICASLVVCTDRLQGCKLPCSTPLHGSTHLPTAGKNLQAQYERWQGRAKYKTHLDPTMEDVKKLAISCRRTAKVLLRMALRLSSLHMPRAAKATSQTTGTVRSWPGTC